MYRSALVKSSRTPVVLSSRPFAISHVNGKTVKEKVSEVADVINKKVGKGLASVIESGEKVTKEVVGDASKGTRDKAERLTTAAGQTANKAEAEARETKEELKDRYQCIKKQLISNSEVVLVKEDAN
ncbi:hypothetical protein BU17DRAFT_62907 [Hysterangium stoloniferum]|nr:hypothetical protein BU17DRAFT_62907 [Hysterangium stoloniferum]